MYRIMAGKFVTASQAQRKWYMKVMSKVPSGDDELGAVCFFFVSSLLRLLKDPHN